MSLVVDTNVIISGIFFGGNPRKILEGIVNNSINAYATEEILEEYSEIITAMVRRKQGNMKVELLEPLFSSFRTIERKSHISVSRDSDDNKFIECAVDAKALYIVSGDMDLLDIDVYEGIKIITAKEFCDLYL